MPDEHAHRLQARRNEEFLGRVREFGGPDHQWVVVVWFYICLQYVDAVLARRGVLQVDGHSDRLLKVATTTELRPVAGDFERLYKESKEARYGCAEYTDADLRAVEPLYTRTRSALRRVLGLDT